MIISKEIQGSWCKKTDHYCSMKPVAVRLSLLVSSGIRNFAFQSFLLKLFHTFPALGLKGQRGNVHFVKNIPPLENGFLQPVLVFCRASFKCEFVIQLYQFPSSSSLRAFGVFGEIHYILGNSNTKFRAFSGSFGGDTYYGVVVSVGKLYIYSSGKSGPFQRILVCREFASDD